MAKKPDTNPVPTLMSGSDPIELQLSDVIDIVLLFKSKGFDGVMKQAAVDSKLNILAPPETVNAIKKFVANNAKLSADPLGQKIMFPAGAAPSTSDLQVESLTVGCCGFSPGR